MPAPENVTAQTIGNAVEFINTERLKNLANDLEKIAASRSRELDIQDQAFSAAKEEIEKLRDILGNPSHILGSDRTKHGEIAEFLEVYTRRAQDAVNQKPPGTTFDGIPRTGPADYLINEIEVQSKFINGSNNTLNHVLNHMENYSYFGRDGSYYQIPNDQFETINKIFNGESVPGLNLNSQTVILNKISDIERITGKDFSEVVKPATFKYDEVQQGAIFKTVDGQETDILQQHKAKMEEIRSTAQNETGIAQQKHQPDSGEATTAGLVGAALAGTLTLSIGIYKKIKEGKKLHEFTTEDWKELGLDTAGASVKGGITGAALYGMTNFTNLSSPVSAALISASFGTFNLYKKYQKQEITIYELFEETQVICVDSALVAIGATVGSVVIPIPVLGALIGATIANVSKGYLKDWLSQEEMIEIQKLDKTYNNYINELEEKTKAFIQKVDQKYEELSGLIGIAYDFELNVLLRLDASIKFAEKIGVPPEQLIRSKEDLERFLRWNSS